MALYYLTLPTEELSRFNVSADRSPVKTRLGMIDEAMFDRHARKGSVSLQGWYGRAALGRIITPAGQVVTENKLHHLRITLVW